MKVLVEDDLMGYDTVRNLLTAGINDELIDAVSLGDRYRVPKCYIHSGIGEVVNIEKMNISSPGGDCHMWVIDLKAAAAKPKDPCDSGFMEEISS